MKYHFSFIFITNNFDGFISEFKLDDESKQYVESAKKQYKEWYESLSIDYILYEGLNKEACKKFKVSPDFIMQLSFQVTRLLFISACITIGFFIQDLT